MIRRWRAWFRWRFLTHWDVEEVRGLLEERAVRVHRLPYDWARNGDFA